MAARRGGLGRGLDSLIPNSKAETKQKKEKAAADEILTDKNDNNTERIVIVGIDKVEPDRNQPRKKFDKEKLKELSNSIKQFGIITPLIVQQKDNYFEIIAGERRWRAANMAGLKEIPVIVKNYEEREAVEISIIENIQREDLNPIEEARAYARLMDEFSLRQEDIAKRVAKNRSTITNAIRLLRLSSDVQNMLIQGEISEGHARTLLSITDEDQQIAAAKRIIDEKMTVRDAEKAVKNILNPRKPSKKPEKSNIDDLVFNNYEEQLKEILGTKVKISRKTHNKGSIEIEYYSDDEFERVFELLKSIR